MAFTRNQIGLTKQLARRLIRDLDALLADIDEEAGSRRGRGGAGDGMKQSGDRLYAGTKASGQVRRASLDLTRQLADLRSPEVW